MLSYYVDATNLDLCVESCTNNRYYIDDDENYCKNGTSCTDNEDVY